MIKNNIIIAKYNEDLSWLKDVNKSNFNIIVYDKSEAVFFEKDIIVTKLENLGREAHTFLFYIINNYYSLPEFSIFLQGEPFFHCNYDGGNFGPKIDELNVNHVTHGKTFKRFDLNVFLKSEIYETYLSNLLIHENKACDVTLSSDLDYEFYYFLIFGKKPTSNITFSPGAQYCLNRNSILNRPLSFYQMLYNLCERDPNMPWILERMWFEIFQLKNEFSLNEKFITTKRLLGFRIFGYELNFSKIIY
jgi:hypothetical protein